MELVNFPKVGIGVVIINKNKKVLVGKRKGSHAQFYSIPGGHLDFGETFEKAAIRETKEETNLDLENVKVIGIANNLKTFRKEGKHYISVFLLADRFSGELKTMEPAKCEEWIWVDPHNLPMPQFDASQRGIKCYLENKFYIKYE